MEKLNKKNLSSSFQKIKSVCSTEKAINFYSQEKYTFFVDKSLKKVEIKKLIETLYQVNVIQVNTMNLPPKTKRVGKFRGKKSSYKKTLVTLKKGESIQELL